MTTLKDISNELGLSVATVSRALNGFPEVNAHTRAQVEAVAKRLNYRPNRLAQKLQSGRSGLIGMVVRPDLKNATDRSFVEIMLGLTEELSRHDLDMVFQVAVDADPLQPYRRLVEAHTVDAFILNDPHTDDARIRYLSERGVPFVVHGRGGDLDYPYFDIDNFDVGLSAGRLLVDLGHRRIGMLNGPLGRSFATGRLAGFQRAMDEASLTVPDAFVAHDDQGTDFGYRAALTMLSGRLGPRPTALICASTAIADGVYRAARDQGLAIPGDLSVIAHDDAAPERRAVNFEPALTVTRAPLRDACAPLARILMARLSGQPASSLQETRKADLIPRNSTGPVAPGESLPWG